MKKINTWKIKKFFKATVNVLGIAVTILIFAAGALFAVGLALRGIAHINAVGEDVVSLCGDYPKGDSLGLIAPDGYTFDNGNVYAVEETDEGIKLVINFVKEN